MTGARWRTGGGLRLAAAAFALSAGAVPAAAQAPEVLIRVAAPLDEARGLCIDIPGHRDRVNVGAALVVHTCKLGTWNFDERFDAAALARGRLRMPEYGLCAGAAEAAPGARIFLGECGGSRLQAWDFSGGFLRLAAGPPLCLAAGPEASELTPGGRRLPSRHVARSLALESCAVGARQLWRVVPVAGGRP